MLYDKNAKFKMPEKIEIAIDFQDTKNDDDLSDEEAKAIAVKMDLVDLYTIFKGSSTKEIGKRKKDLINRISHVLSLLPE